MIVYGRNAVREALRGRRAVRRIWVTKHAQREPWLAGVEVPVVVQPVGALAALCGSDGHQGLCAEVEEFTYVDVASLLSSGGRPESPMPPAGDHLLAEAVGSGPATTGARPTLLVALDQVQDPQNLGAVCRTAECTGAAGLVLPERRSAGVTPAVCKASAGAVEHLPIAQVRNLSDFLAAAKSAGFWCYGAAAGAPLDYRTVDWGDRVVLVLGSEGRGLRSRVAASCDAVVALPLRGRIESLSVSAAAAVLLYAVTAGRG